MSIKMLPKQILPKFFDQEFKKITDDKEFIAAAITMPYKKSAYSRVTPKNEITRLSKSVNLIIKYKKKLIGFNTDIEAALEIIKKKKKDKILIIGLGGTGGAFYNVLCSKYNRSNFYVKTSQNKKNKKNVFFIKELKKSLLNQIDLVINCSPLGSDLKKKYLDKSPLSSDNINELNKLGFVFDIVYKPKVNLLAKLCKKNKIEYENGLRMNTLQADYALKYLYKFTKPMLQTRK
jgi:shikimate dehydrogenase